MQERRENVLEKYGAFIIRATQTKNEERERKEDGMYGKMLLWWLFVIPCSDVASGKAGLTNGLTWPELITL